MEGGDETAGRDERMACDERLAVSPPSGQRDQQSPAHGGRTELQVHTTVPDDVVHLLSREPRQSMCCL